MNDDGGRSPAPEGPDPDDVLVRRVARGDREAFEELYRRNAGWLHVRLTRRCPDPEQVADVLQETFLTAWRAAGGYTGSGSAAGWLWTIASSRLVDAARRRAVRPRVVAEPAEADVVHRSAEEQVMSTEYDARLAAALARLSPELRATLQATVLDGLSTREASVLFGVPEGTVKTRAMRARRMLRQELA